MVIRFEAARPQVRLVVQVEEKHKRPGVVDRGMTVGQEDQAPTIISMRLRVSPYQQSALRRIFLNLTLQKQRQCPSALPFLCPSGNF